MVSGIFKKIIVVGRLDKSMSRGTGGAVCNVTVATDKLGHRDVRGLSAIDPRPRQWISSTRPNCAVASSSPSGGGPKNIYG